MTSKFYVISPHADRVSAFVKKYLKKENKMGYVKYSSEMIIPTNFIEIYILIDKKDEEWYSYYMEYLPNKIHEEF